MAGLSCTYRKFQVISCRMSRPKKSAELTLQDIGERIRRAIEEAKPPHDNPTLVAGLIGVNSDTLTAWMNGQGHRGPGAIAVWKIASLTGKPFSWFAGIEEGQPTEEFALTADLVQAGIGTLREQLARLERDLADARRVAVAVRAPGEAELDDGIA